MSDDDAAVTDAIDELDKMLDSKGWKLLVAQLRREARMILMQLTEVDPTDVEKIRGMQSKVAMYRTLIDRPRELILSGLSEEQYAEEMGEDTPDEFRIEEDVEEYERQESVH